ncbi:MAG TPA: hypothetical protein PKC25_12320, partial [Candidatus Rifleibacterium sp.]|nr:hypothetical protein [Candidatus Rifleibacterium sp.]
MSRRINKILSAVFATAAFVLLLPLVSEAVLHIGTSYSGRFRSHPGFAKVLADLPFVYQESFQRIEKSLGIPAREQMYVVVMFSDHLTYKGFRLRGKRQSVRTANRTTVHY